MSSKVAGDITAGLKPHGSLLLFNKKQELAMLASMTDSSGLQKINQKRPTSKNGPVNVKLRDGACLLYLPRLGFSEFLPTRAQ
mmetsp:Transcript_40647/g.70069  ORF Transcript_40647/g.70069 Transcript_40647/m.70069 type:complete len:83 (+) Transcript_40647:692-940(+)